MVWRSIDEADASGSRFWASLLAALPAPPHGSPHALDDIASVAPTRAGDLVFLGRVVDALAASRAVLVLDDLHEVTDQRTLRDLDYLLRKLPGEVSIVLSSRSDPALPSVQRAKLTGALDQLRALDLALTRVETATLCGQLGAEQARAVWAATEGWPALVQIMVTALSSADCGTFDLSGYDVGLSDYLFQETFRHQPESVQHVLLTCSIPDTFTLDLATQLSGYQDVGHLLQRVARLSGLLTRGTPPGSAEAAYRLHPMLRAYLRDELRRQGGGVQEAAEQTTARWYLAHGRDLLAVRHATRAGDADLLDDVVGRVGPGLVAAGRGDGLLEALTPPVPRSSGRAVWTPLVRALALADAGRLDESLVQLAAVPSAPPVADRDEAEQARHLDLAAAHETMRLQIRRRRGEPILRAELMGASAAPSPDLALLLTAEQGSCLLRLGDLAAATTKLEKAIELARNGERVAALVDCLSILGGIQGARCDLPAMMTSLEEAVALAESHGLATDRRMALPQVLLGWGSFQRLDDDAARLSLPRAWSLREDRADPTENLLVRTLFSIVRAAGPSASGSDGAQLAERLDDVWRDIDGLVVAPSLVAYLAVTEARTHIMLRRVHEVRPILDFARDKLGRVRRAGPGLGDGARGDGATGRGARTADVGDRRGGGTDGRADAGGRPTRCPRPSRAWTTTTSSRGPTPAMRSASPTSSAACGRWSTSGSPSTRCSALVGAGGGARGDRRAGPAAQRAAQPADDIADRAGARDPPGAAEPGHRRRDRLDALRLGEHRQDAPAQRLPQARRRLAAASGGRGSPRSACSECGGMARWPR